MSDERGDVDLSLGHPGRARAKVFHIVCHLIGGPTHVKKAVQISDAARNGR